jgi:hypothetical protein
MVNNFKKNLKYVEIHVSKLKTRPRNDFGLVPPVMVTLKQRNAAKSTKGFHTYLDTFYVLGS